MSPHDRPRKRFGQHFLRDRSALQRIVSLLSPTHDSRVLEIGPGRGALTELLLQEVDQLAAVEIDRDLTHQLRQRFPADSLVLIGGDVLQLDFCALCRQLGMTADERLCVVGNLPYNISKPVALRIAAAAEVIQRCVLMFQREVALRLTAQPGGKDYGPLGILVGTMFDVQCAFQVPPRAFQPPPQVRSTVTVWTPRADPRIDAATRARLREVLAACFARRRQTLRNNLLARWGDRDTVKQLLQNAGLDGSDRAEVVPTEGFLRLVESWPG